MDSPQVAAGLAYVCANLREIRAFLGEDGTDETAALPRLLAALRAGQRAGGQEPSRENLVELLNSVHLAMQVRGDEQGVHGHGGVRSLDALGVETMEIVYRCPLAVCAGRDETEVSELPPQCSVGGTGLVRERLDA